MRKLALLAGTQVAVFSTLICPLVALAVQPGAYADGIKAELPNAAGMERPALTIFNGAKSALVPAGMGNGAAGAGDGLHADGLDPVEQLVTTFYVQILGREPEVEGLGSWSDAIRDGMPVEEVLLSMFTSDEFASRGISAEDTARALYLALLGREPDEEGLGYWAGRIEGSDAVGLEEAIHAFCAGEELAGRFEELGLTLLAPEGEVPGEPEA